MLSHNENTLKKDLIRKYILHLYRPSRTYKNEKDNVQIQLFSLDVNDVNDIVIKYSFY